MNSYVNVTHERRAREILEASCPEFLFQHPPKSPPNFSNIRAFPLR